MFPLIDIHGSPRERGRQYGGHARERIARSIDFYAGLFAYCGMDWREVQSRATRYRQPIADASPALLDEIIGIAEGAGFAETAILALNARTEILPPTYPDEPSPEIESIRARNRTAGVGETYDWGECTALAVLPSASRDGKTASRRTGTGSAISATRWSSCASPTTTAGNR
jgi:isopenicillin-N N-acyltransferase-like protein